ncbi:MAG: 4a-hydroxytetrahydrobiopterin dehydratase, partial [Cyanobacteria bacterium P01_A01_bin.105]
PSQVCQPLLGLLLLAPTVATASSAPRTPPTGWRLHNDALECVYELTNFVDSVEFVNRLVEPSERLRHHPEIKIVYIQVSISLTTHDAGGLTELDFLLAEEINAIAIQQDPPLRCVDIG